MKKTVARLILVALDLAAIALAVILAYGLRGWLHAFFPLEHTFTLQKYLSFYPIFLIPTMIFAYEGGYTRRYDFWHESRMVLKAIFLSAFILFAYLAMTKSVEHYSRFVLTCTLLLMAFLIPLEKNIGKKLLYRFGLWRKKALIYGDDPFLTAEIYGNPYLGYVRPADGEEPATIFVNSRGQDPGQLKQVLSNEIKERHEVIFVPLMNEYDLTHSQIYELFNTRTNLIVYQNRLKSRYRLAMQQAFNYLLALFFLPFLLPLIALFAFAIKLESPGPVFFTHRRIGHGGAVFRVVKFRSMYVDAQARLQELLARDDEAKEEWETTFKLKEDPRITRVGAFLRRTSLDELPQIFNVLRGEMNFVGPRPVTREEIDRYYRENAEYYFMVKPGITGLWQVSGRNDIAYDQRVALDRWYVSNWSIWLDVVILLKTVKVVLQREGAY